MSEPVEPGPQATRRSVVAGGLGAVLATALPPVALADQWRLDEAVRTLTGGATPLSRGVKVDLPELAENGFSVPIVVEVEGPMTAERYVETIHILSERNPVTRVAEFRLGRRAGRARIASNVRLAESQRVLAIARMSDGTFLAGDASVLLTLAACIDGG